MADSDGLGIAAAAVGLALIAGGGTIGSADATPVATILTQQIGQPMRLNAMYVTSVPADEGFWVDSDHGRMWVQIETVTESPYDVHAGDTVAFSGRVVAHGPDFPATVGVDSAEGAADLARAGAHISIPVDGLGFVNTGI